MPDGSSTAHLYRPKLLAVLQEGYSVAALKADALAALTVAVVALPLSMAFAIASGVSPERGLVTTVVGGFLVSAVGGSRYQIGGPAGAFIVLVAATVTKYGIDGLLLTVLLSGFLLVLVGLPLLVQSDGTPVGRLKIILEYALAAAIGLFNYFNRFNNSLKMEPTK